MIKTNEKNPYVQILSLLLHLTGGGGGGGGGFIVPNVWEIASTKTSQFSKAATILDFI